MTDRVDEFREAVAARKIYRLSPRPEDAGIRLDQYVSSQVAALSKSFFRRIIDLGGVHVGGRRVRRCDLPVRAEQTVEIYLDGQSLDIFSITPGVVLYRDDCLIAIDKPAGIETQPTPARYKGTVYEALLRYLQSGRPLGRAPELGMIQRLDRDTSGVMVFSIHSKTHRRMSQIFSERLVEKNYLALIDGEFPDRAGELRSQLARNRRSNQVRSVLRGGKEAITRYRVLNEHAGLTLLEVQIVTGRSHQIRVHLAEAGCPVLGDRKYGGTRTWQGQEVPRLMLHAHRLLLPHPLSGTQMVLEAPLPPDWLFVPARQEEH